MASSGVQDNSNVEQCNSVFGNLRLKYHWLYNVEFLQWGCGLWSSISC